MVRFLVLRIRKKSYPETQRHREFYEWIYNFVKFLLTIKNVIMDNEKLNELSGKILDAAIEVHRILGPGLLEIVYETCLCKELTLRNIAYKRQDLIPIIIKSVH